MTERTASVWAGSNRPLRGLFSGEGSRSAARALLPFASTRHSCPPRSGNARASTIRPFPGDRLRSRLVWTDWPECADAARTIQRRPATMRDAIATKAVKATDARCGWAPRGGRRAPPARAAECGGLGVAAFGGQAGFGGHGDQLREGLWGERVQGGLRSGGGDGARGRPPPPPPGYGHGPPCARAALVQEHAHDPRRGAAARWTASPSPSPWCPPPG